MSRMQQNVIDGILGFANVAAILSLLVSLQAIIAIRAQVPPAFSRHVPCPQDATIMGYTSIADLNDDLRDERERIRGGGAVPTTDYLVQLCPNMTYDVTGGSSIRPVLNNLVISCPVPRTCRLSGGNTQQVRVEDSNVNFYPINFVTLDGLAFQDVNSNNATFINALASAPTVLTVANSLFETFTTDSIVTLGSDDSNSRMTVEFQSSIIRNGQANVGFDNRGGVIMVSDLSVSGMRIAIDGDDVGSLLRTTNNGRTIVSDSAVSGSTIEAVTLTMSGETELNNMVVESMEDMETTFAGINAGSITIVRDSLIQNNNISKAWSGLVASNGASSQFLGSTFSNNGNLKYGVIAQTNGNEISTVLVDGCFFLSNSGFPTDTLIDNSALVASAGLRGQTIIGGNSTILSTEFSDNIGFTANIIAFFGGTTEFRFNCFFRNNNVVPVFIAEGGGNFQARQNYAEDERSIGCTQANERVFVETDTSAGCFMLTPGGICRGDCRTGADTATTCTLDQPPDESSTAAPTMMQLTPSPVNTAPPVLSQPTVSPTTSARPSSSSSPTMMESISPMPTMSSFPTVFSSPTLSSSPSMDTDRPTFPPVFDCPLPGGRERKCPSAYDYSNQRRLPYYYDDRKGKDSSRKSHPSRRKKNGRKFPTKGDGAGGGGGGGGGNGSPRRVNVCTDLFDAHGSGGGGGKPHPSPNSSPPPPPSKSGSNAARRPSKSGKSKGEAKQRKSKKAEWDGNGSDKGYYSWNGSDDDDDDDENDVDNDDESDDDGYHHHQRRELVAAEAEISASGGGGGGSSTWSFSSVSMIHNRSDWLPLFAARQDNGGRTSAGG